MPKIFTGFLKQKKSSDKSVDKYEYGIEHSDRRLALQKQKPSRKGWGSTLKISGSNKNGIIKRRKSAFASKQSEQSTTSVTRSSRTLGSQNNFPLITLSKNDLCESEEDDSFDYDDIHRNYSSVHEKDEEESTDGLQELDRATVRLDGIEVYAIVSALTCATSISCFDNFEPTPMDAILNERAIFTLLSELFYYASGALGMMSGLHATLIFSLVTMYGRTALGINRDDAFNEFFGNTGAARFNGFMSFKLSLYCFMTQLCFLIGKKFVFTPLRPLVLAGTLYLAYKKVYVESEAVLAAAGVIYSTPPTPTAPQVTIPEPGNLRASLSEQKRRGSKKSSCSLSTRNFGVDTSSNRMSFISSDSKTNDE